jgi:hypothetical protein
MKNDIISPKIYISILVFVITEINFIVPLQEKLTDILISAHLHNQLKWKC